jgi:hypothetical protein
MAGHTVSKARKKPVWTCPTSLARCTQSASVSQSLITFGSVPRNATSTRSLRGATKAWVSYAVPAVEV